MTSPLFEQYKAALRRGHLAALGGDLDDALAAYREAARLVPERALPIASQATVLHRLNRWPEAAEAFDLALRLAPDDEATLRARATARDERGLRSGAAADFERLAFVLDVAGRVAEAAEAARRSVALEATTSRQELLRRLSASVLTTSQMPAPPAEAQSDRAAEIRRPRLPGLALDQELMDDRGEAPEASEAADPPEGAVVDALDGSTNDADAPGRAEAPGTVAPRVDAAAPEGRAEDLDAEAEPSFRWPPIDLPSAPPPPMVGPPPDPETLLAEATALVDGGDPAAARDLMLTAVAVHRAAGRLDAAIDVCLQLLALAPGDSQVHLAIAGLQLDRGWTALATEKLELLLRLTSLNGDVQAEADTYALAAERLRDDAAARVLLASAPRSQAGSPARG